MSYDDPIVGVAGEVLAELTALRAFFEVWWNEISTFDPGDVLTVDGTVVTGIAELVTIEDSRLLDAAGDRVLKAQGRWEGE